MKIVVCMKQVPATSKVDIDPETGAMKRMSGETRTNPYDLFALETALAIREKTGGTVTVLTMGPPQAEEMIRDAYTMGADEGVILSDRKFAGADVLATSYALAQGIQVIGGADLIICGRQTTDGDTAQVGPAIAEHLTIPHAAWVAEIMDVNEKSIQVRQDLVSVSQVSELPYSCLITIEFLERELIDHVFRHKNAEIAAKSCLSGPHKDDLELLLDGRSASAFASQGQVRTCTLSLKLAERELFFEEDGEYPVLLLDDVLSELDRRRQDFVLNRISAGQVMITCCEDGISEKLRAGAAFHIKNGKIV